MSSLELKGTIKKIGEINTFASGFQKREFVLLTEEQYPQAIAIELMGDKIDIIDAFSEGDRCTVGINLRGRVWTSPQGEEKYFNTIVAWKITKDAAAQPAQPVQQAQPQQGRFPTATPEQAFGKVENAADMEEDDLPF